MLAPPRTDRRARAPLLPCLCGRWMCTTARRRTWRFVARAHPGAVRMHSLLVVVTGLVAAITIGGAPTAVAAPETRWSWPVDGPRVIERGYAAPATPYGRGHRGVDIRAGSTLTAPATGVVRFAGVVVDRPVLTIDHGGGIVSSYEPVVASVAVGDRVARGDQIGTVLDGHCAVRCVHLGVRVDGQYVSPLRFLDRVPPAVLLPTRGVAGDG